MLRCFSARISALFSMSAMVISHDDSLLGRVSQESVKSLPKASALLQVLAEVCFRIKDQVHKAMADLIWCWWQL